MPSLGWVRVEFLVQVWNIIGEIGDYTIRVFNGPALLGGRNSEALGCAAEVSEAGDYVVKKPDRTIPPACVHAHLPTSP